MVMSPEVELCARSGRERCKWCGNASEIWGGGRECVGGKRGIFTISVAKPPADDLIPASLPAQPDV